MNGILTSEVLSLLKDNLVRRNWNGNKQCYFCSSDKTIQHLFIDCHVAKFLWRVVQFAFNLNPPHNITHLFGSWLRWVGTKLKRKCKIGKIVPELLAKDQVRPGTFARVGLVLELSFFGSVTSLMPMPSVNAVCHNLFRPWVGQIRRPSLDRRNLAKRRGDLRRP